MKSWFVLVTLSLAAVSAQAAPVKMYLRYNVNNGSVSPMYRSGTTCMITNQEKGVTIMKKSGDIVQSSSKKVVWKGIPNVTVLKSLIEEASLASIDYPKHILPAGGSVTSFTAYKGTDEVTLLSKKSGYTSAVNRSEASNRLMDFLKLNCGSAIVK